MRQFGVVSVAVAVVLGLSAVLAAENAPTTVRVAGQLTKIEGKALTITADGKDTVITCTDATSYSRDGSGVARFEDLQVGQSVRAYYIAADNTAAAVIIAVPPAATPAPKPIRVAGQLTRIEGKALTITADGKDTVITCTDATKFSRDGSGAARFEDLQVGQPVRAYYTAADNTAQAVIIAGAAGSNTGNK